MDSFHSALYASVHSSLGFQFRISELQRIPKLYVQEKLHETKVTQVIEAGDKENPDSVYVEVLTVAFIFILADL